MEYITSQIAFKGQDADPTLALTDGTITLDPTINKPGHGGNTISIDVAQASNGVIEYVSRSYPTNADFTERPGAVVKYNINFGNSLDFKSVLPNGYIPALFLEFSGSQYFNSGFYADQNSAFSAVVSANDFDAKMLCGARTAYGAVDAFGFSVRDSTQAFLLFDGNTSSVANSELMPKILTRTEVTLDSTGCRFDGVTFSSFSTYEEFTTPEPLYVGTLKNVDGVDARGWKGKIYNFKLSHSGVLVHSFVPAIAPDGLPCMFDTIKKQPVYNIGDKSFYVGMTVEQARQLGKLPVDAPNNTLTISLPQSAFVDVETGEIADAEVNAALAQAEANKWVITKQYYTE